LADYLLASLVQVQAPYPLGCGRLLVPEPPVVEQEGKDVSVPVTRTTVQRGRRVNVADAREVTRLAVAPDAFDEAEEVTQYTTVVRDGQIVRLDLPQEPRWRWSYVRGEEGWDTEPPWRTLRRFEVTGRFGFAAIPPLLVEAIYILAARSFYEREAQYADRIVVGEGAVAQSYFRDLPPRARLALETYSLTDDQGGLR
jgi:hypothetical protein